VAKGTSRDISRHGVRVQFLDEVKLNKGDLVQLKLHESEGSDKVTFEGSAKIVWSERVGKIRPVWNVGMTFENLSEDQSAALQTMLKD
jgi:PilZ domain